MLLPVEMKSLVGYNPWSHKESDTTEQLHVTKYLKQIKHYILGT